MKDPNYHLHEEIEALQPGHSYIALFPKHCLHAFLMCSHMASKGARTRVSPSFTQKTNAVALTDIRPCWYCQWKLHGLQKSVVMKFGLLSHFYNLE